MKTLPKLNRRDLIRLRYMDSTRRTFLSILGGISGLLVVRPRGLEAAPALTPEIVPPVLDSIPHHPQCRHQNVLLCELRMRSPAFKSASNGAAELNRCPSAPVLTSGEASFVRFDSI